MSEKSQPFNTTVVTSADGALALSDNQVAIVFDTNEAGQLSSTGKTHLIASSRGARKISATSDITFSLNVMRKVKITPEEMAMILKARG
jgi:hypothetical protein|tara:strand:+ start:301 stop:567 length:267 start_codon:yes stop_codon:yes gene_type:complete